MAMVQVTNQDLLVALNKAHAKILDLEVGNIALDRELTALQKEHADCNKAENPMVQETP